MKQQVEIGTVVRSVRNNVGKKVKIRENKGRNKVDITEGVISEVFPCVFTIEIPCSNLEPAKVVSYSYADVLTRDVELVLV